jgi:hypothetical protein
VQAQLQSRTAERDARAKELADAQAHSGAMDAQLKEAREEGELLLLQLHQVQEELEQLFLQGKEKDATHQNALADVQSQLQSRTAERDARAKELADARAALDKAQQASKQAAEAAAKALADVQSQLQSRTAERDARAKELADARAALDKAQQASKQVAEAAAKALGDVQAQLQSRTAERDARAKELASAQAHTSALDAQLKEAREEGELLLLQLHQVQEELETHFLRGKTLDQDLQQLQRRYERIQRRYPLAVDIDMLEIVEADASSEVPGVVWRLKGLSVQGRIWPELTLTTTLGVEGAGFRLDAPAGSPLHGCMAGPLAPKALAARESAQIQRFRALGATAWRCMVAACAAVDEALATPALIERQPPGFDAVFWVQALGPMAMLMRALPAAFRHDGVKLIREKVNPDYEHLGLVFEGAAHGPTDLGPLEMRLSAAQVQAGGFSKLPKLEFPLRRDGQQPFDGWFEESHDDHGAKFELRADLSRKAFDLAIWSRLPKQTQAMLLSLIATLPDALAALQQQGSRASRPWSDWKLLTEGLIEVIRIRLAPPKPALAPTPAPAPLAAPPARLEPAAAIPPATLDTGTSAVKPLPREAANTVPPKPAARKKAPRKSAKPL